VIVVGGICTYRRHGHAACVGIVVAIASAQADVFFLGDGMARTSLRYLRPVLPVGTIGRYFGRSPDLNGQFCRVVQLQGSVVRGRDRWLEYSCAIWSPTRSKLVTQSRVPMCCLVPMEDVVEPCVGPTAPVGCLLMRAVSSLGLSKRGVFATRSLHEGWTLFWRTGTVRQMRGLCDPGLNSIAIRNGVGFIIPGTREWKNRWSAPEALGYGWRVRMHDLGPDDANVVVEVRNDMPYLRVLRNITLGTRLLCRM
jgi:hypothetical protein